MIYHEAQASAFCGVHAINTVLQAPIFTEWDLGEIAQQLDRLERDLMAAAGTESADFAKFMAEGSGNVSEGARRGGRYVRICM